MSEDKFRKTWAQPWSYLEGTIITLAIIILGFVSQAISGGVIFRPAGFPWNMITGIVLLTSIITCYIFWHKHIVFKTLGSINLALPAIFGFTFLVLLMGFIKQDVEPGNSITKLLGLNQLVKTWPFILINLYLMVLLIVVTMKRMSPFNLKNVGFFLNHFGLFLFLFSTALGRSDVQRLSMNCYQGQPEWRATDADGKTYELPLAINLQKFNIDEFRPKVTIVDNTTGQIALQNGKSQYEMLDRNSFDLAGYQIIMEQFLESSGRVGDSYFPVNEPGSAPSAKLKVTKGDNVITGWVCSGSFAAQPEALKLNEQYSLVMLPAEPQKFSSTLSIQTKSGKNLNTTIEVNKPFELEGWTIYQLGYKIEMGRWSDLSVLELVRDPWLPVVYLGIFLMMAGATFLFFYGKPKTGGTEDVA